MTSNAEIIYEVFVVYKNLTLIPGQTRTNLRKPSDNRHLDTTALEKFGDFECVGTTMVASTNKNVKISSATLSPPDWDVQKV